MSWVDNIKKVGVADILTMSNGLCGLLAIFFFATQGSDITIGSALILLGFVFDGADGWAARRFGTKHDFGRHLDSISDGITFCAAPAAMVYVTFTGGMDTAELASARTVAVFRLPVQTKVLQMTSQFLNPRSPFNDKCLSLLANKFRMTLAHCGTSPELSVQAMAWASPPPL